MKDVTIRVDADMGFIPVVPRPDDDRIADLSARRVDRQMDVLVAERRGRGRQRDECKLLHANSLSFALAPFPGRA